MTDKMWAGEPFWGLGYEWDPDWVYTDKQQELRATLIELCEKELRANAKRFDDELLFPPRFNLELLGEHGSGIDCAGGVRRPRREPRRLLDGLRDDRPVRLRLDGDVLRDAHGRRERDHAPRDARADRQVHPPRRDGVRGRARDSRDRTAGRGTTCRASAR